MPENGKLGYKEVVLTLLSHFLGTSVTTKKTFYDVVTKRLCDDCVTTTVAADDVIDDATEADSSLTRSSMETMGPLDPGNTAKLD